MATYKAPEGYIYDSNSGLYYSQQIVKDTSGNMNRFVTWFNADTGQYTQYLYPMPVDASQVELQANQEQVMNPQVNQDKKNSAPVDVDQQSAQRRPNGVSVGKFVGIMVGICAFLVVGIVFVCRSIVGKALASAAVSYDIADAVRKPIQLNDLENASGYQPELTTIPDGNEYNQGFGNTANENENVNTDSSGDLYLVDNDINDVIGDENVNEDTNTGVSENTDENTNANEDVVGGGRDFIDISLSSIGLPEIPTDYDYLLPVTENYIYLVYEDEAYRVASFDENDRFVQVVERFNSYRNMNSTPDEIMSRYGESVLYMDYDTGDYYVDYYVFDYLGYDFNGRKYDWDPDKTDKQEFIEHEVDGSWCYVLYSSR